MRHSMRSDGRSIIRIILRFHPTQIYFSDLFLVWSIFSIASHRPYRHHHHFNTGMTGILQLLLLFIIVGTSAWTGLRSQRSFEAWWSIHHLFIPFYLLILIHGYVPTFYVKHLCKLKHSSSMKGSSTFRANSNVLDLLPRPRNPLHL